ncbi:hypothetical protein, partial [Phycobacter sp. K97]|uniref:hypothetical protein n=1 Tax=Phycobacter sedimenti TaxID=3133977 RepID=UPI00311E3456
MIDKYLRLHNPGNGKSWLHVFGRSLHALALACLLTAVLFPAQARADFTSCPVNNVPTDPINLNLTDDVCTRESSAADISTADFIAIRAFPDPLTEFEIFDETGDARDLIFNVNNGTDQGTITNSFQTLNNIDCSSGCVISGTHGGVAFASFTYTQSGSSGSVTPPASDAEIDDLTSSTGNTVADGGTDTIAAAITSGTATTVTYTVANSGSGPL